MPAKKRSGSTGWIDPDDAPELTAEMLAEAEVFTGERFVRRGPGRPHTAASRRRRLTTVTPSRRAARSTSRRA